MIESPKDFAARIYGMMEAANGSSSSSQVVEPEVL